MSLREKLAAQAAEMQAQREREKAARQEEQVKPIRDQIAELEAKKQKLQAGLAGFVAGEEASGQALREFKAVKKPIDETFEEFKDVAGSDKADFVRSNEEETEVKNYRAAGKKLRESVSSMRAAKESAGEAVEGDLIAPVKKRDRKSKPVRTEAKTRIEQEISNLDQQIAALKEQTPEGQAEKQTKLREKIRRSIEERSWQVDINQIERSNLITHKVVEETEKQGEQVILPIALEETKAAIGKKFDEKRDKPLYHEVDKLAQYSREVPQVESKFVQLRRKEREMVGRMTAWLQEDKTALDRLNSYGIYGDAAKVAQEYFKHIVEMQSLGDLSMDKLERRVAQAGRAKNISYDSSFLRKGEDGRTQRGSYNDLEVSVDLPDLEDLNYFLDRFDQAFDAVGTQVIDAKSAPIRGGLMSQKLLPEDRGGRRNVGEVFVKKDVLPALAQRFGETQTAVQREREKNTADKERLLALVEAKFNVEWINHKIGQFQSEQANREVVNVYQERKRAEEAAKDILRELHTWRDTLRKTGDREVVITEGGSTWDKRRYAQVPSFDAEEKNIDEADRDRKAAIEELDRQIKAKTTELEKAWRQRTKDGIQTDIDDLKRQVQTRSTEAQRIQQQRHEIYLQKENLQKFMKFLGKAYLPAEYFNKPIALSKLLSDLPEAITRLGELNEEQQGRLSQYQQLQRELQTAQDNYKKLSSDRGY